MQHIAPIKGNEYACKVIIAGLHPPTTPPLDKNRGVRSGGAKTTSFSECRLLQKPGSKSFRSTFIKYIKDNKRSFLHLTYTHKKVTVTFLCIYRPSRMHKNFVSISSLDCYSFYKSFIDIRGESIDLIFRTCCVFFF